MKNQTVSINQPAVNIQVLPNDNSFVVRGTGPDGYINRSIMKDDPECEQKLLSLLDEMYTFQKDNLDAFCADAPGEVETQYSDLIEVLKHEFESEDE